MAADGSPGRWVASYRRRHALPVLLVLLVLGVATAVTWTVVLSRNAASSDGFCNAPAVSAAGGGAPGGVGQIQPRAALDAQDPVPPSAVRVRVLNGGGQRDQAKLAASELAELGFGEAGDPANDPLYPASDLTCFGQIRYGPTGKGAARVLSLVVPCAELVRDGRPDDTVDLSLGKDFRDIDPPKATRDALGAIARDAAAEPRGGQQAQPTTSPNIDAGQLNALREVSCGT